MKPEDPAVDLLRKKLWAREFAIPFGKPERWMAQAVSNSIEQRLGLQIEQLGLGNGAPHPDTILNFFIGDKSPSPRTLNILSWYLKENHDEYFSFENFKADNFPGANGEAERNVARLPNTTTEKTPEPKKQLWLTELRILLPVTFLILAITGAAYAFLNQQGKTEAYHERFSTSNLDTLRTNGWSLFNDSIDLTKWDPLAYRGNGYLTLETHLGDSWLVNRDYKPRVINILSRKINCGDCCTIKVKIVDFNPYQRYQKAGFYVFYSDKTVPSLRYGLTAGGKTVHIETVKRDGEYNSSHLTPIYIYSSRSVVGEIQHKEHHALRTPDTAIDSLMLSITVERDQYFFEYSVNNDPLITVASSSLPYGPPQYVGLTAQQGRPDVPHPVRPVADIIPAKFEYFSVQACQ